MTGSYKKDIIDKIMLDNGQLFGKPPKYLLYQY